jgi:hypothetical protein
LGQNKEFVLVNEETESNLASRGREIALAKFIYCALKKLDETAYISDEPNVGPPLEGAIDWGKSTIDGKFDLIRLSSMILKELAKSPYRTDQ